MTRRRRRLAVTIVVAALVAPAVFDRDSFPLSTYPMYSRTRGDVVGVATANGITSSGESFRLSLSAIGDIDDPLIVEALVRDAVRGGPSATDDLCRDIAERLAGSTSDFDRVAVVTERHNVVDHASDRPSLVSREVHSTCEVEA